jgi:hypothetical protein
MTNSIGTPLFSAIVGGHQLRFFLPPDGDPDFPWHSIDDLGRCLGLNRVHRKILRSKYLAATWPKGTVAVKDEILSIAPHFAAQGTIEAMIDVGRVPASVRIEYDCAGAKALEKLMAPLPFFFGSAAWFGWMKAAMHRHERASS